MKRHCKARRIFKHCMKRIEDELERTDNKRVEVKRALIKFTKENMLVFGRNREVEQSLVVFTSITFNKEMIIYWQLKPVWNS